MMVTSLVFIVVSSSMCVPKQQSQPGLLIFFLNSLTLFTFCYQAEFFVCLFVCFVLLFLVFVVPGLNSGSCTAQVLYHVSHAQPFFCFSYFLDRAHAFCPGQPETMILLPMLQVTEITALYHCT
jgi:hypothetical protein